MANNEYGLPKLTNAISMTKVKNAIHKINPSLTFKLSNIRINGQLRGCSGFITNPNTNKIAYINTESVLSNHKILYRTAEHNKDFTGGSNQYTDVDNYAKCIIGLIT